MSDNKMVILEEQFENEKTGEEVTGVTILVEGKLKQVFDVILHKNRNYKEYRDIVQRALIEGIGKIIEESR